jgi:hypothetical protein
MNLWGVTPLLAAALLGGGIGTHTMAADHISSRGAGQSTLTRSSARQRASNLQLDTPATPPVSIPGGTPTPVLRQTGSGQWQTTVVVNDIDPGCSKAAGTRYLLATTSPDDVILETGTPKPYRETNPGAGNSANGSSCVLQITFPGPRQVPQTAALVIDQPGASSTITLTVSRNVTLIPYLVIPLVVGLLIAVAYLILALRIKTYDEDGREQIWRDADWREHPILGSGAWTIQDSWATNISTALVVVSSVLSTTAAASSLFPGVALDRFALVNIAAGVIVAAAPVIFGISYAKFTADNPGLTADAIVKLPPNRVVTINLPSGASITLSADTAIQEGPANSPVVRAGSAYQIPAGSNIVVQVGVQTVMRAFAHKAEALIDRAREQAMEQAVEVAAVQVMGQVLLHPEIQDALMEGGPIKVAIIDSAVADAGFQAGRESVTLAIISAIADTYEAITFPGTADIGVLPGTTLRINSKSGPWTIQKSDMVKSTPWDKLDDAVVTYPVLIDADGGAKITVTGAADMGFPSGAKISAPRRPKDTELKKGRKLLAPLGAEVIVANMRTMLIANMVTMLGLGAELGIAGVLAYFSEAATLGRIILMCAIAFVGLLVLTYARSATRAMADPQPGSSLSAQAGTSFTL